MVLASSHLLIPVSDDFHFHVLAFLQGLSTCFHQNLALHMQKIQIDIRTMCDPCVLQFHQVSTKSDEKQKSFINSPFFCSEFQSVSRIVKIVHSALGPLRLKKISKNV